MGKTLIGNKLNKKNVNLLEANVELKVHFLSLGKTVRATIFFLQLHHLRWLQFFFARNFFLLLNIFFLKYSFLNPKNFL